MGHTTAAYKVATRKSWDQRAHKTLEVTPLPDDTRVVALRFEGTCPACHGQMAFTYPVVAVIDALPSPDRADAFGPSHQTDVLIDAADEFGLESGDLDVRLHCSCGPSHKGHPEDDRGCGARFSMRVKWGPV
jgi:hypothetical protein